MHRGRYERLIGCIADRIHGISSVIAIVALMVPGRRDVVRAVGKTGKGPTGLFTRLTYSTHALVVACNPTCPRSLSKLKKRLTFPCTATTRAS